MFNSKLNTNFDNDLLNFMNNLKIDKKKRKSGDNAIIYTRCSTAIQNNNINQSLQTQICLCIDYCNQNNLSISEILKDIHHGHNIDQLKISSIPDNYSDCNIIIADPSRLSRNVSNTMDFITKCINKNIKIHFVRDELVSDSNQDIKKIINLTLDAYIETQTLSKRLKTTFEIKKKNGSSLGRIPFGFESYNETNNSMVKIRKLKPKVLEQDIITLINMMYFGCNNMLDFYKIFQKITNNLNYKLMSTNGEFNQIYYGNFTKKTIIYFLNENNILNRNKAWTIYSVDNILNKSENFPVNHI
jgi:DNA invertase Pin-like site-specific DNA recombinase